MLHRPGKATYTAALPFLLALLYPIFLKGFHSSVHTNETAQAATMLILAFCAPLLGTLAAIQLGRVEPPNSEHQVAKWVALLAIAAPPLYTAAGVLLYMAGDPISDIAAWFVFWGVVLVTVLVRAPSRNAIISSPALPTNPSPRLRVAHGVSALVIVLLFLGLHLSNHLAGLLSESVHRDLMKAFRLVYRAKLIEPAIVALFFVQVVSGLMLLRVYLQRASDAFRTLQVVSGAYLVFFILGHMNSVFIYAREFAGIQTDWNFATGAPTGLVQDAWNIRLVPHYYLGVFFVLTHLVLGARVVALAHGKQTRTVDAMSKLGIAISIIVATATLIGMSGVHLAASGATM